MKIYFELYGELVLMTAVVLLIIQIVYPYRDQTLRKKGEPPERFLGPFSLGELIMYIFRCLTMPIAFGVLPNFNYLLKAPVYKYVFCGIVIVWFLGTDWIANKIDHW